MYWHSSPVPLLVAKTSFNQSEHRKHTSWPITDKEMGEVSSLSRPVLSPGKSLVENQCRDPTEPTTGFKILDTVQAGLARPTFTKSMTYLSA